MDSSKRFPVFHVPHDGIIFPAELMESVCIPEKEFLGYHRLMRDSAIREVVPDSYRDPGHLCCFEVSRQLCDVERFIGSEEIMEAYGMGFCYERAYDGRRIKTVTDDLKEKTLRYYRQHHERMDDFCRRHGRVMVFDIHSYSDEIVPKDFLAENRGTPDICIGADNRYTPPALAEMIQARFEEAGFTTAVNYPYSGCYIPDAVFGGVTDCDCIGIMLEFHKRTYIGQDGNPSRDRLEKLRAITEDVVSSSVGFENDV